MDSGKLHTVQVPWYKYRVWEQCFIRQTRLLYNLAKYALYKLESNPTPRVAIPIEHGVKQGSSSVQSELPRTFVGLVRDDRIIVEVVDVWHAIFPACTETRWIFNTVWATWQILVHRDLSFRICQILVHQSLSLSTHSRMRCLTNNRFLCLAINPTIGIRISVLPCRNGLCQIGPLCISVVLI